MRKHYYLLAGLLIMLLSPFSGEAQISGPATVTAGQSATWTLNNASVTSYYTWSPDAIVQPADGALNTTSVSAAKLGANTAMTTADYPSIWYDSVSGRWFAFTISRGITANASATLYRLDLGTDPTPANINAANQVTTFNLSTLGLPGNNNNSVGGIVHAVVYDPDSKSWHLFWIKSGANAYNPSDNTTPFRVKRLDFGNSLANTPGAPDVAEINLSDFYDYQWNMGGAPSAPQAGINSQVAQSRFVRAPNGDYLLFVGNRWGPPTRINFGTNITNTTPKIDRLPRVVTHGVDAGMLGDRVPHAAMDVVQQGGKWFVFIANAPSATTTNGNQLWRYDLGTDPTDSGHYITLTGLGVISGLATHSWGLQIIPSACGNEFYGFLNQQGNIRRLNFGNDLTNKPTAITIGTVGQNGLPAAGDNSGLFAYVYGDSLYAVMGGAGNHGIYSMRLPYNTGNQSLTTKRNNSFMHTYATPGTYELTAGVNLHGGGAAMYCHTVTVTPPGPSQPGAYTAAPASVCRGQNNVTYTVPSVSGATSYEWVYSGGTGVTFSGGASTATPTNNLSFSGSATSGTLRVRAVNGNGNSPYRDTAITVNALPAINISPATVAICAGQSATLMASGAATYTWSPSGGNVATANVSPTSTTTYTVTGTSNGCSATASRQVIVNPLPVTQVTVTGGITDVCAGDSVVLTASGSGYTYNWKEGSSVVGSGNRYAARSMGSYKVVATDAVSSCSDSTQAIDVRVYARPVVSLDQNDTSFCSGGVVRLEVNTQDTGLTYAWMEDGVVNTLATADFLEISESGVYQVIVGRATVASCADSTNEVRITVHDLPVVNTIWDGEVLHATPGYVSYQWNTGSQGIPGEMDSTFRPSSNGGYSVTVTDSNGCGHTSAIQNLTNVRIAGITWGGVIKVYPNPSEGVVYIESPVRVDVLLLGMDGRLLQCITDAGTVDLGSYTNGVYLLRMLNADGMVIGTERVMKR